jgi:hypothetical protein
MLKLKNTLASMNYFWFWCLTVQIW